MRFPDRRSRLAAYAPEGAIVTAAVLYGATFAVVQDALERTTPMGFNLMRFALASVVIAPFAVGRPWSGPAPGPGDGPLRLWWAGVSLGCITAVAYLFQNIGLQHTTTSNSAFITGLFAVFTPIIESVTFRRLPRSGIVAAVAVSVAGLFLLTGADLRIGYGDAVTLITAACFGAWYVRIGTVANRFDVVVVTAIQLLAVAVLSVPVVAVTGLGRVDATVVVAVVFTGIGCSAVAFSLSTWGQRVVDPSRAAIINLLEPVVAGAVGYLIGERLGVGGYLGAALILAGILVAERGTHRPARVDPAARGA